MGTEGWKCRCNLPPSGGKLHLPHFPIGLGKAQLGKAQLGKAKLGKAQLGTAQWLFQKKSLHFFIAAQELPGLSLSSVFMPKFMVFLSFARFFGLPILEIFGLPDWNNIGNLWFNGLE